jgi:Family of unknown function (DUF5647)
MTMMKRTTQVQKNLALSEKLMTFLSQHPDVRVTLPEHVSFVAFSKHDTKLNQENMKLIDVLVAEGKHVVKAFETKSATTPWKFDVLPPA